LMFITSQFPALGFDQFWISAPEFLEFRDYNQAFENVGGYRAGAANLGTEQPSRVNSIVVTHELLEVLGVNPLVGRKFTREDTLPEAEDVGILSYELWQREFGSDRGAVGRVVPVNGLPTRIVGIMPPGFDVHDAKVELWLPLTIDPKNPGGRGGHFLYLVGRTKPGVSIGQARADLETLLKQWATIAPNTHVPDPKNHRFRIDSLHEDMIGGVRTALWVLQGAVGFVLLIACANLANLLLARSESRHREFAVRTALGASRTRLLRQFLTEGVVLAIMGAIVGVGLAYAGLRLLLAGNPNSVPRAAQITIDPPVLIFTLVVAVFTGLLFGLSPLLHVRETLLHGALKEGGTRTTGGKARARTRSALVTAEVALAVVLVAGAGLLLRSFWNLMNVDAGFNRARLSTFGLVLPAAQYRETSTRPAFFARALERIARIPGVNSAAAMSGLPPLRLVNANDTAFEGSTAKPPPDGPIPNVDYYQTVTSRYVETMGIPVVEGRAFTEADAGGPWVMLVNEALAKKFYPNSSPVGRRIKPGGPNRPWFLVVGVLKDVKQGGLAQPVGTELYFLYEQLPRLGIPDVVPTNMNVVVRSDLELDALAPSLRQVVREADPTLPMVKLRTMRDVFGESVARPRFIAQLLGAFAGLALLLAAIGTYGILSYTVSERHHEIGIRMALGASRSSVLGLILRQGATLTGIGLVAGIVGALLLSRVLGTLLFNVRPTDPATMAAVTVFITAIALIACYVPARRATRVDPIVVLREE
jgi:predicted permease